MEDGKFYNLESKVARLEDAIETIRNNQRELRQDNDDLYKQTQELITGIALLNQSVKELVNKNKTRGQIVEKILMFAVGGFIAAAVSWVVRGGLGS